MNETVVVYDQRPKIVVEAPGPQGPAGIPGITVVSHGTDTAVARPNAPLVYWIGTARPANALPYDLWYNA